MRNRSIQFKLNTFSLLINLIAIVLLCTPQYCITVQALGYTENIWFGLFNFSGGNIVSMIKSTPELVDDTFWGNVYGVKSIFAILAVLGLIYLIHHILNYTFAHKRNEENKFVIEHMYVNISEFYYEYSVLPLLISVGFSWIVFIVASNQLAAHDLLATVAPSVTLIFATVILLAQAVVNIKYRMR